MSETTGHSPLPWYVGPYYRADIESPDGRVAECRPSMLSPRGVANAALIVEAVNAHASLLHDRDTLRAALQEYGRHKDQCSKWDWGPTAAYSQTNQQRYVRADRHCTCGFEAMLWSISESETP